MTKIVKQKHIVIDARLYGPKHTGLGRYTKNLLLSLPRQKDFKNYRFTLLVYPELASEIASDLKDNYQYAITNLRHYSIAEQIFLPILLKKLKPDLVHFTHLDKPILYFGKSVVTVHDLIRHFSKGSATTTRSPLLYWPKYWAYMLMTKIVLATSHIIVPSEYWRQYIINRLGVEHGSVTTTHEAVDPSFLHLAHQRSRAPANYILYTGNLYPHKNINVIIEALKSLPNLKLKIICARSVFRDRLQKITSPDQVEFLGYVKDTDFAKLYSKALALVHPAFIEGFSLTGLEAMALNCPVIASNATCLPEIYQDSVLYFNPNQPSELVSQIKKLQDNPTLRQDLISRGQKQIKKYSWLKTAKQTLDVYQKLL
jgi:glycosyltransferase involved in cell wall biosynthesis